MAAESGVHMIRSVSGPASKWVGYNDQCVKVIEAVIMWMVNPILDIWTTGHLWHRVEGFPDLDHLNMLTRVCWWTVIWQDSWSINSQFWRVIFISNLSLYLNWSQLKMESINQNSGRYQIWQSLNRILSFCFIAIMKLTHKTVSADPTAWLIINPV